MMTWLRLVSYVCGLLLLSSTLAFAQPTTAASERLPAEFLPRSPVAAVFPRYGNANDVNLITGAPQLSLPLTTLSSGALQLPVSLTYNYSGLQVAPTLELVGMGWRLQAGGSITRRVQGALDDNYSFYDDLSIRRRLSDTTFYPYQNFLRNVAIGNTGFDMQPDLYSVNLPGYNGDFLVIHEQAVPLTVSDVRIVYNSNNSFSVTLANGVIYQFNTPERINPAPANFDRIGSHISSWHLSQIVSANRQDTIQLHYSTATYQEPQRMAMTIQDKSLGFIYPSQQLTRIDQRSSRQIIPLLDSISTRTERVVFVRGTGTTASQRLLQAVRVYTRVPALKLTRVFGLQQSYFNRMNAQASDRLRLDAVQEVAANGLALPPYTFHYENSVGMPSAQSLAQDHWGYYNGQNSNPTLMPFAEPAFMANRQPDFAFAKGGALLRITYPTGGSKEFEYEANNYSCLPYAITRYEDQSVAVTPYSSPFYSLTVPGSSNPKTSPVTLQEGSFTLTRLDTIELVTRRDWAVVAGEDSAHRSNAFNSFPEIALYQNTPTGYVLVAGFPYQVRRSDPIEQPYSNTRRDELVLPAGTYKLVAYCEAEESVTDCTIRFPFFEWVHQKPGPGIRVMQTTTHSSLASLPDERRQFAYTEPDGYSSGSMLLAVTEKGEPYYKRYSYRRPSNNTGITLFLPMERLFSTVTDFTTALYKYQHFYRVVTETSLLNGQPNGKTVTYHTNFVDERQDVRPTSKRVYVSGPQGYTLVQQEKTAQRSDTLRQYILLEPFIEGEGGNNMTNGVANIYSYFTTVIHATFSAPDSVTTTTYGPTGHDSLQTVTALRYTNFLLTHRLVSQSNGSRLLHKSKYLRQYDPTLPALGYLRTHYFNPIVEEQTWRLRSGGAPRLLSGSITLFDTTAFAPASSWRINSPEASNQLSNETVNAAGQYTRLLSDGRYQRQQTYQYTAAGNLAQAQITHASATAYVWGYRRDKPIAAVRNAAVTQVAYTSFEVGETNGWMVTGGSWQLTAGYTGTASYQLAGGGTLRRDALPAGTYVVSCWLKEQSGTVLLNGQALMPTATVYQGWRLCQQQVTLATAGSCTFSGTGQVDEVRLVPTGAQLTSYTYDFLGNLSAQVGPDQRLTTFEYDGLGRLLRARDEQGRILSQQQYHYKN